MTDQMDVDQEKPFWLADNFPPVFEEFTRRVADRRDSADLNRRFLRNGPNPQNDVCPHWYRNRYVQTPLKAQFA